jgi:hypothetical protein
MSAEPPESISGGFYVRMQGGISNVNEKGVFYTFHITAYHRDGRMRRRRQFTVNDGITLGNRALGNGDRIGILEPSDEVY